MKTKPKANKAEKLLPIPTPGDVLKEDFLRPLNITNYRLAMDIGITPSAVGQIIAGARSITPDVALRLGDYFGTTAKFWLNLQNFHDVRKLDRERKNRPAATKKAVKPDEVKISLRHEGNAEFWAEELGVAPETLRSVVQATGGVIKDVRAALKGTAKAAASKARAVAA